MDIPGLGELTEVGKGGFGTVYRAEDPAHGRTVAVKVLNHSLDADGQGRFERECRAAGSLSGHPNVVAVHGSGVTSDGSPYLIMDYLPGGSLAERVAASGPLDQEEAITLGLGLCSALAAAHDRGTIHRDVKPENVLFSPFGAPQLVDFGIARMASEFETRSGSISASLLHAAPEVIAGGAPSPAGDLYSLASVLFFALTGRAPFQGEAEETLAPLIARISTADPPDLRDAGVSDQLATVIEHGLAKSPGDRPADAHAFAAELAEAARRLGVDPPRAVPVPAPAGSAPTAGSAGSADRSADGPSGDTDRLPGRSRRRMLLALGGVVAVIAVITGVIALQSGGDGTSTADPPRRSASPAVIDAKATVNGVESQRRYTLNADRETVSSQVRLRNTTGSAQRQIWFETIPKSLARSVDDVTFLRAYTGVVVADPVVYWVLDIPAGGSFVLGWTTDLPAGSKANQAALAAIVEDHRRAIVDSADEVRFASATLEQRTGAKATDPTAAAAKPGDAITTDTTATGGTGTGQGSGGTGNGDTGTTEVTRTTTTVARTTTTVTATTTAPPTKPGAPRNPVVASPSYGGGSGQSVSVQFTWDAPSSGGAPTSYTVRHTLLWSSACNGTSGSQTPVTVTGVKATSTRLSAITNHYCAWIRWEVAAVNAAGTGPYVTATGIMPNVIGLQNSYALVRSVGGNAGGLADRDCGQPSFSACYASVAAGTPIASGRQVNISLQP